MNDDVSALGKPQKKFSTNGRPFREGGGGEGRAIKEKRTSFKPFLLLCYHLKIEIILL